MTDQTKSQPRATKSLAATSQVALPTEALLQSTPAPAMTQQTLETLQKNPQNIITKYEDNDNTASAFEYESSLVVSRFEIMRKKFMEISGAYPNYNDEQCIISMCFRKPFSEWKFFLTKYPLQTKFVLTKQNDNQKVANYLQVIKTTLKVDKDSSVEHKQSNKVDKNHPDYQKIMNKQNQTLVSNLFSSGLVKAPKL